MFFVTIFWGAPASVDGSLGTAPSVGLYVELDPGWTSDNSTIQVGPPETLQPCLYYRLPTHLEKYTIQIEI